MKFCIDIDGVLRNMITPMLRCYNSDFDDSKTVDDITDYDVEKIFSRIVENSNYDAFTYFFTIRAKEILRESKPVEGSKEALDLLHQNGDEVIIVSYQPTLKAKIDTLKWLNKNKIYYDKIVFTDTPSKKTISDHCDFIIDDRPEYLSESSATQVCIDYPYNRNQEYSGGRWRNIYEFVGNYLIEK